VIDIQQHWKELSALIAFVAYTIRNENSIKYNNARLAKLEAFIVDSAGKLQFLPIEECRACRMECKQGMHSIHVDMCKKINELKEDLRARASNDIKFQQEVVEQLAELKAYMKINSERRREYDKK
jgi:hypothetical protein